MEVTWALILSVCTTDYCATQNILETAAQDLCMYEKTLHEQLPPDGNWKTIKYECKLLNSVET